MATGSTGDWCSREVAKNMQVMQSNPTLLNRQNNQMQKHFNGQISLEHCAHPVSNWQNTSSIAKKSVCSLMVQTGNMATLAVGEQCLAYQNAQLQPFQRTLWQAGNGDQQSSQHYPTHFGASAVTKQVLQQSVIDRSNGRQSLNRDFQGTPKAIYMNNGYQSDLKQRMITTYPTLQGNFICQNIAGQLNNVHQSAVQTTATVSSHNQVINNFNGKQCNTSQNLNVWNGQSTTLQHELNKIIFTEYSDAVRSGKGYLDNFQRNYRKPHYSQVVQATGKGDKDETDFTKVYEQIFNVESDHSPAVEEKQAMMQWYKEPSYENHNTESGNRKRNHSASFPNEPEEKVAKSSRSESNCQDGQDGSNVHERTDIHKDEFQSIGVPNPLDSSTVKSNSVDRLKDVNNYCDDVPKNIAIATESSNGNASDIENNHDLRSSIQREKREGDKNIMDFMDVMSVSSPYFMIWFHGRKILCISRRSRKYVVLRELIFHFFKDRIAVVKATLADLGISKTLLGGQEKGDVSRYLLHQKVFSDKRTKHIGIIQIEEANRLYHKLRAQNKCDVCVKLASRKVSTMKNPTPSATVVIHVDSDSEEQVQSNSSASSREEKSISKKRSRTACSKKTFSEPVEDGDSDSTLPYGDEEDDIKSNHVQMEGEPSQKEKELITAGVIDLNGNLVRYVRRNSTLFVPAKDINKHFSSEVMNRTIKIMSCSTTKCRDIEHDYFLQFHIGLDEIVPGDILVDAKILDHIYAVANEVEDNQLNVVEDSASRQENVVNNLNGETFDDKGNKYKALFSKVTNFCKKTMSNRHKKDENG